MKKYAKSRNSYIFKYAKSYFGLSNSDVKKYFGDVEWKNINIGTN